MKTDMLYSICTNCLAKMQDSLITLKLKLDLNVIKTQFY